MPRGEQVKARFLKCSSPKFVKVNINGPKTRYERLIIDLAIVSMEVSLKLNAKAPIKTEQTKVK